MPLVIPTLAEWTDSHGGLASAVKIGGDLVFPDGAIKNDMGCHEPPSDQWECLRLRRARLRELVRLCERQFNDMRNSLLRLCQNAEQFSERWTPPTEQDLQDLLQVREWVGDFSKELLDLDGQWLESPDALLRKELEERHAAKAAEAARMRAAILDIYLRAPDREEKIHELETGQRLNNMIGHLEKHLST